MSYSLSIYIIGFYIWKDYDRSVEIYSFYVEKDEINSFFMLYYE